MITNINIQFELNVNAAMININIQFELNVNAALNVKHDVGFFAADDFVDIFDVCER